MKTFNENNAFSNSMEATTRISTQKMLLPLYLEKDDIPAFDNTLQNLNNIADMAENEYLGFEQYYGVLKNLAQENRALWQLNNTEESIIATLAADSIEVSSFAKALLSYAYANNWNHYQEQGDFDLNTANYKTNRLTNKSKMLDAAPNPAKNTTTILAIVSASDARNAHFTLTDPMGKNVYNKELIVGIQTITLELTPFSSGVYTYSLVCNGRIIESKKLVITR